MGTIYYVACKKCKVVRDLDKFYNTGDYVENRNDAISHAKDIQRNSFRPALLVSFMAKHMGHECVFFNEHSEFYKEDYADDHNYWRHT